MDLIFRAEAAGDEQARADWRAGRPCRPIPTWEQLATLTCRLDVDLAVELADAWAQAYLDVWRFEEDRVTWRR